MIERHTLTPRRGRPPIDEGRDTRARILDAALDGFARQGFAGTSIRQIARAVGVRESAIYSHFTNKQAIFDGLLAETGPAVLSMLLESGVDRAAHPATALPPLIEQAVDAWDQPRARRFLSVGMREGGPGSALLSAGLAGEARRTQEALGDLIRTWVDAGHIRGDIPVDQLVWELIAPIVQIRMTHLLAESSEATRRAGRQLAARHLDFYLTCVTLKEADDDRDDASQRAARDGARHARAR